MMNTIENTRNPILPLSVHIPDAEARVMPDGRLYLYGSYDDCDDAYCSDYYRVASTPDLAHWTVHDVSLRGGDIPWFNDPNTPRYPGIDWSKPSPFLRKMLAGAPSGPEPPRRLMPPLLYAPDCVERGGKYYLYFCMADDSEGVAVSERPEGPFTNSVRLPCGGIDPSVFIDDDGQAYYYWGQIYSHGVRLNDDMVSFDPKTAVDNLVTEEKHCFHEGSSIRKIGGTYYYIYADMERGKPTSLGYATAKSPLGPFEYKGIIIDNDGCDPGSWTNHGSIQCFNGQWYVFYHRSTRGTQRHRRLCIEPIAILEDGTIPEVKMTSQGLGKPFGPGETIMGYQACGVTGRVRIDVDEETGEALKRIAAGDTAVFRYVQSGIGFSKITIRARGSGRIKCLMDGVCTGAVEIRDGVQYGGELSPRPGRHELTLRIVEADGLEILSVVCE